MTEVVTIPVEVCYAEPQAQWLFTILVPVGATIGEVLSLPEVKAQLPAIDLSALRTGIFGKIRAPTQTLSANDRLEIYRPLLIDPKQARRARARE